MTPIATARRIQRRRSKGWRMPEEAVLVCRPSEWGNPFVISKAVEVSPNPGKVIWHVNKVGGYHTTWIRERREEAQQVAVDLYRAWLNWPQNERLRERAKLALRGRTLCCWCRLDQPCHADILLKLVNE